MAEEFKRIGQLEAEGLCCSSIIIQMGLDLRRESNEQFVKSAKALCNGIHSGLVCGALTGSVCMLALFDSENTEMTKEMTHWFKYELCARYGSVNCKEITNCSDYNKKVVCPGLIKATYTKAKKLLSEFGYIELEECSHE